MLRPRPVGVRGADADARRRRRGRGRLHGDTVWRSDERRSAGAAASDENVQCAPPTQPGPAIPANIKAYVPALTPLTQTEPVMAADGAQGRVELLVTVGPRKRYKRRNR